MAAKLSPAVIVTGPKDDLLANDGRGNTPTSTINKLEPTSTDNESLVSALEATKEIAAPFIEAALVKKITDPRISDSAALRSMEQSIGTRLVTLFGATADAESPIRKATLAFRDDKTGRDPTQLYDASGRIVQVWDRTDPTKVSSLSRSILQITRDSGTTGLIDPKGKFAVALGLLETAVALGVPELIDDIVTYVKANKEAKRTLIESVRSVIMRSDLPTLNKILDYVGSEGVLQRVPEAIPLLLTFYRLPWGTKPEDYPARRNDLLATLARIKTDWNLTERNSQSVTDLGVTNYISSTARMLLSLIQPGTTDQNYFDQPYLLEMMLVGEYPIGRIDVLSRNLYPEIAAWRG